MKKRVLVCLASAALAAAVFADTVYSPADGGWGAALTVASGETVVIDAGDVASAWSGAVTVESGGILKTRGRLSIMGVATVKSGATLDVESGTSFIAFNARTATGTTIVRSGATLELNRTDAFNYTNGFTLHVYGTVECKGFRISVDSPDHIYIHDGARITGDGDGNGIIDVFKADTRIVVDGESMIEGPIKARFTDAALNIACCENAHPYFKGGFIYGSAANGKGNIVQVAATADEGNASGTCANAVMEIGPSSGQGKFVFTSKGVVHLAGETQAYSVETTGAELDIVAEKAVADELHAAVQTLPAITTSTATVRLLGDGVVALQNAAPAYPIAFAGATLQIDSGSPVALAAGSSVTADTLVGVDGLAANTAATLFTGADATFDVSKVFAIAMHNGMAISSPVSAALDGASVTIAGLPAYDASAWIEPFIRTKGLIWLDASDAANFVFKDNTFGLVQTWKDRTTYHRDASFYASPAPDKYSRNYGTYGISAGVPAFLMGETGSSIDLKYARMTNMRTIFWVMAIEQNANAWFLGDSGTYRFHRTTTLAYAYDNANVYLKNGSIYCDGVKAANPVSTIPPTDRHVYSTVNTSNNMESDYLTSDVRDSNMAEARSGGRDISEFIAFDFAMSDADREAIEAYLAAKWMGASPTAAGIDGTYKFTGEATIDGSLGGDKNLVFAEGASITIVNPSSEGAMLKTSGTIELPAGAALPVAVDARLLMPGTYTVIEAKGGITSLDQFAATALTSGGVSASFFVAGGCLEMTIVSTTTATLQTWRPQSALDLGWNATSENWLLPGGGGMSGFLNFVPVLFDGDEAVSGPVEVTGEHTMGPLSVIGDKDYTFTGDGALLGSEAITLGGSGTITLNGPSLGDQEIVIDAGRRVVLGENASESSLGTDSGSTGGKVTVREGGQFNANYLETTAINTAPRAELTHRKTFVIAGDGPDGRGAFINDALDGRTVHDTVWASVLRRVELAGDATIGGVDRFDVRDRVGTAGTATPGIYGPGKKLTLKTTGWFGLISHPIEVGSMLITGGGVFRPEGVGEAMITIPGGITLDDGSLHCFSSAFPADVAFTVESGGGQFNAQSGTTTIKGPVTLKEGAELELAGSGTGYAVTYSGGMNVASGTVRTSGGRHNLAGPYDGTVITQAGADTYLANGFVSGDLEVTHTSGGFFIQEGSKAGTINVTQSAGSVGILAANNPAPEFTALNITSTGGAIDLRPQSAGMLDVAGPINVNQSAGNVYVYGPNVNADYGIALTMTGSAATLSIGLNSSRPGTLRLKEGTDLTVKNLYLAENGTKACKGHLIIDQGAKVKVTDGVRNGHWSQVPDQVATHTIDIYGELDATGINVANPWDSPRSEIYVRTGAVLKANGFYTRSNYPYGNGVGAGEGRQWLMMEGGRLELGSYGFNGNTIPGVAKVDFQNGEIVNVSSAWGGVQGFPVFFGYDKLGGSVVFDMAEYYVNWNQALSGASDLTIRGSVNFTGARVDDRMQGVTLGRLTVENTGGNDLRVTSAFVGGLTLADGVNAQVAKYSDERYMCAVAADGSMDYAAASNWSYPFVSSDFFPFINRYYATQARSNLATLGRGEFYVPEDKVGVWTFVGNYDDKIRLDVDGAQVFKTTAWNAVGKGQVELAAGWHKFTIAVYAGGAPGGTSMAGFKDRMAVGYLPSASDSTNGNDYIPFTPGGELQIRPCVNACVWSWQNGNANWDTTENWAHIKCMDSTKFMHTSSDSSNANDWKSYFSGKASKINGWFKVEPGKEGEWAFRMAYDDYKMVTIDGEELFRKTSEWYSVYEGKKELEAGWHRWEIRFGDGSGGWGPSKYNGVFLNDGNTLSFIEPGSTENRQWNEDNIKLAATLGDIAVLEPTGIYGDLELGEGATLTSDGTMAMPIFGALKGTGTLAGSFAFAGEHNSWHVEGVNNNRELASAKFAAPTRATFLGLKEVKAEFDAKPVCSDYFLTDTEVPDLVEADLADVKATVTAGNKDYSSSFSVGIVRGRLALKNRTPGGLTVFVR